MTKKEWENCNTCWTCKHRKILAGRIHCGHTIHDGTYKALWNVDIINSPYCPHREKEDWRNGEGECKYCKNPSEYLAICQNYETRIFVGISGEYLQIFDEDYPGFCDNHKINFCPMCGRKLS